jgi:hypothetical protein
MKFVHLDEKWEWKEGKKDECLMDENFPHPPYG